MQRILSRSTLTLTLTWTLTLTRMRCNRNQFQKELMRGLESTTGGMKAVELQAGLTMVIVLTRAKPRMAILAMAMLTCVPSSCHQPWASLPPCSLPTYYYLLTTTYPLTCRPPAPARPEGTSRAPSRTAVRGGLPQRGAGTRSALVRVVRP